MSMRASALILAASLAAAVLQPTTGSAQSAIGSVTSVRNDVEGILGGQTSRLTSGSAVRSNELIRSGEASAANLIFLDQTRLAVGPRSEVRLDKFIYEPNQPAGSVVVNLTKGAYRFVTGVQTSRSYEIKTPVATIGVRGTILEINLESYRGQSANACQSNVKIRLVEGAFIARTISGRAVSVNQPGTLLTVCSDGSFQVTPNSPSILNFQPEFAAVPNPDFLVVGAGAVGVSFGAIGIFTLKSDEPKPISP